MTVTCSVCGGAGDADVHGVRGVARCGHVALCAACVRWFVDAYAIADRLRRLVPDPPKGTA